VGCLLQEVASLRQEVRLIAQLRPELDSVKLSLQSLVDSKLTNVCDESELTRTLSSSNGTFAQNSMECNLPMKDVVNFPSLNGSAPPEGIKQGPVVSGAGGAVTYAKHATSLEQGGMKELPKRRPQPVVGISKANKCVKSVQTVRSVEVFVSRLHPETTAAELKECVDCMKDDLSVTGVTCNSLKSKYANLYASFHIAISVDVSMFAKAIEKFMSADAWPNGVLVRRYFKPKDGRHTTA